ncbi:uncharacterized protein LOC129596656 [Paramacrobiotus metropolitanus]|uniref:uncharacterized protein LOC129596656 n=1 Tax=Paramacrobiotus metropolitanus TaxID=2943436 RepID=UPI0024464E5D|nr:uncharacterized protein LOC129596656 [Paramacrobiotus metropolitanus]
MYGFQLLTLAVYAAFSNVDIALAFAEGCYGCSSSRDACSSYVLPACSADSALTSCSCATASSYNVSQIADNITDLSIGDMADKKQCDRSCLLSTFLPLPSRPRLHTVRLFSIWVAPDDQPFPVNRFLSNVKGRLTMLDLYDIYLPVLTRDTLAGFERLQILNLQRNRMANIAVDAFGALNPLPGRMPQLSRVWIAENSISHVDWSIWKPVAVSLTHISLENDGIREIFFSRYFALSRLETLYLDDNQLTSISDDLLASISAPDGRPYLRLGYNPLCLHDGECDCASMSSVWAWYQQPTRLAYPEPGMNYLYVLPDALTCGNYTTDPWERERGNVKFVPIANVTRSYRSYQLLDLAQRRSGLRLTDSWLSPLETAYLSQLGHRP